MAKKGRRNLVLEIKDNQFKVKDLEKAINNILKLRGVKYIEDVDIYLNTTDCVAYCVVEDRTYKVNLGDIDV